jgi:MoaA/NifB/PqqE/SkfB family radical SAM enzyme
MPNDTLPEWEQVLSAKSDYLKSKVLRAMPRLPLQGSLDFTYRCNNNCRHCWLRIPPGSPEKRYELTLDEIKAIVDQARAMGCREWSISGGEHMLRPDFADIFDYVTRKATHYSLNTNGTLITPAIAQLLKRKGTKMIALYGATAEVYDDVTRHPGGFEAVMRGFAYLREVDAGFIVQLIPMRANWHQWDKMIELAQSLSPHWRVGAPWLYLSSSGSAAKNREIAAQRLSPRDVIELDKPDPAYGERMEELQGSKGAEEQGSTSAPLLPCSSASSDDRLFALCIAGRRDFHIDAYGMMSWCCFVKDPALRYDLRRGTFREAWEEFIPSCADKVRGGDEWRAHCGRCEKRADCRWCAVYAYLETGRYSAPIPYLCAVADEARKFKDEWQTRHRRYFRIAGITVRVESDLDFDAIKFKDEFAAFAVDGPGDDNVTLRHHFELPDLKGKDLGEELYRKAPWAISRQKNGAWIYRGISPNPDDPELHRVAVFNPDHTHGTIYSPPRDAERIRSDGWHSLSLFPTDQIWLAPLLADRHAVLLHSAAAIVNGQGLLFIGHADAGKSTTMMLLKNASRLPKFPKTSEVSVEILCDDRNVVRKWAPPSNSPRFAGGELPPLSATGEHPHPSPPPPMAREGEWRVHGTWSHGDVADVSSASAPLRAILFLQQADENAIIPLTDRKEIWRRLLATLIKPMVTAEWWQKELDVLQAIVDEIPCYTMRFDQSGAIVAELVRLADRS